MFGPSSTSYPDFIGRLIGHQIPGLTLVSGNAMNAVSTVDTWINSEADEYWRSNIWSLGASRNYGAAARSPMWDSIQGMNAGQLDRFIAHVQNVVRLRSWPESAQGANGDGGPAMMDIQHFRVWAAWRTALELATVRRDALPRQPAAGGLLSVPPRGVATYNNTGGGFWLFYVGVVLVMKGGGNARYLV